MESLWFGATVKSSAYILLNTAFCGMLLLTASAAAQTVEGTVVDTATGSGIAAARVFLIPASGDPENGRFATADPLGHFRFEGVKTGSQQDVLADTIFDSVAQIVFSKAAAGHNECA